ncbi:MAG: ComEC/Rec2 family competence protein, partial [Deltaproteobacteria bacterium]|nr:ComEC/Rec2 family competence protein [Deltaproteobacteria bacterium]
MILVSGRASRLLPPDQPRLLRWALEGLAASLGATAGTLPVVALHFQSLSPASPLANLWAVPWIGTLATPLALVAAVTTGTVHDLALALADAAATAGLWGLRGVDIEPWAPAVGVAGAAVLGLAGLLWRREILALGLTLAVLAPWPQSRRELVVSFLAVGQGDAALVEWPDGRRWLVDGGPPGQDLLRYLRRRGIRRLDSVFVSHGHPDHYGGLLPVLDALEVREVVARGLVAELAAAAPLWTSSHPSILPLPRDFEARDENDRSLVLRFGLGAHTFLLPGDAEWAEEQALVAANCAGLQATVLKVGHHGSHTSSSAPFLACARPEHAVISSGFDNRYRHPHAGVLRSLATAAFAPRTWRTDQQGTIEFRTDGERLRVRAIDGPSTWRLRDGDNR